MIPLLNPERIWECPSCRFRDRTVEAQPHTRMHACRALGGLTAPMVDVTAKDLNPSQQQHVLVEREDYVGREIVQTAGSRPIQALITKHRNGSHDCTVYAPTATGRQE